MAVNWKNMTSRQKMRLADDRGFYLLEVLIAMAILSIGVLAAAQMQANSMAANTFVAKRGEAQLVAQSTQEMVAGAAYASLTALPASRTVISANNSMIFTVQIIVGGEYQVNLGTAPSSNDPYARNVTINVKYQNKGKEEIMTFITTRSSAEG